MNHKTFKISKFQLKLRRRSFLNYLPDHPNLTDVPIVAKKSGKTFRRSPANLGSSSRPRTPMVISIVLCALRGARSARTCRQNTENGPQAYMYSR